MHFSSFLCKVHLLYFTNTENMKFCSMGFWRSKHSTNNIVSLWFNSNTTRIIHIGQREENPPVLVSNKKVAIVLYTTNLTEWSFRRVSRRHPMDTWWYWWCTLKSSPVLIDLCAINVSPYKVWALSFSMHTKLLLVAINNYYFYYTCTVYKIHWHLFILR